MKWKEPCSLSPPLPIRKKNVTHTHTHTLRYVCISLYFLPFLFVIIIISCFCFVIALNDALKEEIQHLKVLTGQSMPNGGPMMNFASFGAGQQFYPNNNSMHTLLTTQQFQQLQIHSQKQQHQFQQQQLHQLQQQQMQQELQQQQQQQQTGDLKRRGSMSSPSQTENASDINPPVTKEC